MDAAAVLTRHSSPLDAVRELLISHGEQPSRVRQLEPAPDPCERVCNCAPCRIAWSMFDELLAETLAAAGW